MQVQPLHGLRLAARGLARVPGTAFTAMAILGIALSAVVVTLGVLDSAIRPLPVPHGGDVVQVRLRDASSREAAAPAGPLEDWVSGPDVAAAGRVSTMLVRMHHGDEPSLRVAAAAMTPSTFRLLQVPPALGRIPTEAGDDDNAVLLGWDVYQQLGARSDLVGATLDIEGSAHRIIGVMPQGFGFPEKQSLWTVAARGDSSGDIVVRLVHGVRPEAATQAIAARLSAVAAAQGRGPRHVELRPWTTSRGEGGEARLFAGLSTLVALLLIVCAANVATLLMVRAEERAGVLAVHAALGASRFQVGYQLFAEALCIALGGGLLGLAAGYGVLRWMQVNLSVHWGYYWMTMEVRPGVAAGAFAAMLVTALVAGTAPALRAMKTDLRSVLAGATGRGARRSGRATASWFVGAQVAFSTIGLVTAAVMAWNFVGLMRFGTGLPLKSVAIGTLTPTSRYDAPAARAELYAALSRELQLVPGARRVALSTGVPGFDGSPVNVTIAGRDTSQARRSGWLAVNPGYLDAFGLQLIAGRGLRDEDTPDAPAVALVTASFARRFGVHLGDQLRLAGVHDGTWATIVGLVRDWNPDQAGSRGDRVLVPLAQARPANVYLSVATAGDASEAVRGLRLAVARVDRDLVVESPQTLGALIDWLLRMPRVIAGFVILGGVAGVLVAGLGLYGVVAFQVRTRMPDIGVRMALGADGFQIRRDILRFGLARLLPGLAAGMLLAAPLAPRISGVFARGAVPVGPLLGGVVALLFLVGLASAWGPASRAAKVDPLAVLRDS